jgi:gliding motility-associated-like protein
MKYTLTRTDYDKRKFFKALIFTFIMFVTFIHSVISQNGKFQQGSKIYPLEKIVKECSYFSDDTLQGFDVKANVKEALPEFKNVKELKAYLVKKEIEFVRKKYHAENFLSHLTNQNADDKIAINSVLTSACNNIDFENGNFSGWTGSIGYNLNSNAALNSTAAGINTLGVNSPEASCSYHTIVSTANDPYSGLSMVSPGGGSFSARLGGEDINEYNGSNASGTYVCSAGGGNGLTTAYSGGEVLQQTFNVTSSNALFSYSYAVILNDGGHSNGQQPYFRLEVLDASGNPIPCLQYYQQVTSGTPPTGYFISGTTNWLDNTTVYCSPWTQNSLNLTAYIGQNITVRFTAAGCNGGAHFGYAYVDCSCGPVQLISPSGTPCAGTNSTLTAPPSVGGTYQWSGPGIVSGSTNQTATVNASGTYSVTVTGAGGCVYTIDTTITFIPNPTVTVNSGAACGGTPVALNANGATTYSWSPGTGLSSTSGASVNANPASTTVYTVTGKSGTCSSTATSTVTVNPSPNAGATAGPQITCGTTTTSVNGSSTTPGVTFSWNGPGIISGANTATATVNSAGTYTLTVTSASGCTSTATAIITSSGGVPNSSASAGPQINCTSNTTTVNGSSTTAGVNYSWSGPGIVSGGNTATATVNTAGAYTLTVTDPANGCTSTTSAIITSNTTVPNASASAGPQISCTSSTTTVNGSSTTAGVTYSWSGSGIISGGNAASATVNAAGTYTLTVTNPANGCSNTCTATITSNGAVPNITTNAGPQINCLANTTTVNGSSTTAGVTYSWSGTGIVSGATTATATVNSGGTYTLTVTNPSNGCTNVATAVITSNTTPPNATASAGPQITCTTNTTTINGSSTTAGVNYNWAGPGIVSGGNTAAATVNAAGTYTLTVTDPANGCTSTATAVITTSGGVPNSSASAGPSLTCINNTSAVNGSSTTAGVNYNWAGPGIVSGANTATATVNASGVYTLTVTDPGNGCTSNTTATITANTIPPNVSSGAGPQITCVTNTTTVNGSSTTAGVTYNWAGAGIISGANTATATVNAAGPYSLTVTDPANGCTNTSSATITTNTNAPTVFASAGPQITCTTNTTTVNSFSTTAGVNYSWTGPGIVSGANAATATVNAAGDYTVTVTDPSNGCTNTAVATITNSGAVPNSSASAGGVLTCITNTTTVDGSSVTAGVNYNWSGAGIVSGANTATATVNAAGVYTLTVTDPANGCNSITTTTIISNTIPPNATANPGAPITCTTNTTTADGSCTTAGATYSWSGPGIVSGTNSNTAIVNATGNYIVTVTDPSNGCTSTASAIVTSNTTPPNATASGNQISCSAASTTVDGSSTTAGVTYSWSGTGITSGANTATATVNTPGTYTLTVTDPANGCTNSATASVTSNSATPNITAAPMSQLPCGTNTIMVNASSTTQGVSYSWAGPGIVAGANAASATVNAAGNYTVTVTDPSNGCFATAVESVIPSSNPTVTINPAITTGCAPVCVTFTSTASGSGNYNWNFGDGTNGSSANASHCYTSAGNFTVQLIFTDANACVGSATASVVVYPLPHADFNFSPQPTTILEPEVHFSDVSTGGISSWNWSLGENTVSSTQNPIHSYTDTGSFAVQLMVVSNLGCKDSIVKIVHIDPNYEIYVPSAFTPNSDGINDSFMAKGEGIKDFKLFVFDRWGNEVFYSDDIMKGWDGKFMAKGTDIVQEDVYVWKIELKNFKNQPFRIAGQVSLMK